VREDKGVGSSTLAIYNVQAVPEYFLIDRGNNVVKNPSQIKDVEAEIRALL
jgi:hypothetical protein